MRASERFPSLPSREREVLGFAIRIAPSRAWGTTTVDLSHRIDRLTFGKDWYLPTITPGNYTWLVGQVAAGAASIVSTTDFDPIEGPHSYRARVPCSARLAS